MKQKTIFSMFLIVFCCFLVKTAQESLIFEWDLQIFFLGVSHEQSSEGQRANYTREEFFYRKLLRLTKSFKLCITKFSSGNEK